MSTHTVRQGSVYKRCTTCGRTLPARKPKRCPGCDASLTTKSNVSFSWRIDVAPKGEKRKVRSGHGYATAEEADKALQALRATLHDGTYVEKADLPVGEYLGQWVKSLKLRVGDNLSQGTWDSYELIVRRYLKPTLGDVPLQALSRAQVKGAYAKLRDNGAVRGKGLSGKSVHNVHLCLRKALKDAVEDKLIPRNPADAAHRAPSKKERAATMTTWTAPQLGAFLDHVSDDRLYAAWLLLAGTGMRRGEVLGLKWEDIDLDGAKVHVVRSLKKAGGEVVLGSTKTGKGRPVDVDPTTVAALKDHRKRQLEERMACGSGWQDSGLVFTMEDGTRIDPDGMSQRFDRHNREAKLPRIRLHDLRHTHATLSLKAGVHPKVVQERLGHSSISVTLDTYSHAVPSMQADAAALVAGLVSDYRRQSSVRSS